VNLLCVMFVNLVICGEKVPIFHDKTKGGEDM